MTVINSGPWAEKARFGIVAALLIAGFFWGGGSRLDIPGLILLQPFACLCAAASLLVPGRMRWGVVRVPLLLLLALAIVIAAQLVPLPPALWTMLPGQEAFLPFTAVAGGEALWRPLSLTPDATLAALIGLVVPAAALIGFASLGEAQSQRLLPWLLVIALISAVFGLAQILGGPQSGFYRYAVTNEYSAVGLFSNRNHQAVFLLTAWPMLALWARGAGGDPWHRRLRGWIALAAAIALFPVLAAAGSRAGLALALPALAAAWWLLGRSESGPETTPLRARLRIVIPIAAIAAAVVLAIVLPRAEAIERLMGTAFEDESRLAFLPTLWRMALDFLPFGAGFGAFDPVFRFYEPEALLARTYLNHAHNDLLELAITGGVPALLVAAGFLIWAVRRTVAALGRERGSRRGRFASLGAAIILLILLSSLVDYPLRTPAMAMLFAFACGWLGAARDERQGGAEAG